MIALIDKSCAKEGYEFVYLGQADECAKCGLRIPCHHNLERGRRYRVVSLKEKIHPCPLFQEIAICDIEEVGVEAAIQPRSAFEGASITFPGFKCSEALCVHSPVCIPEGLRPGDRCTILDVKSKISCPKRGELRLVTLKRI